MTEAGLCSSILVVELEKGRGLYRVRSRSNPSDWYVVRLDRIHCPCLSFKYQGRGESCYHVELACAYRALQHQARADCPHHAALARGKTREESYREAVESVSAA